jgi:glycosyltransferase involved in cell wall biosynthesis
MIAPIWVPVPPPGYGGTELIVSSLTEGLVAKGHEVTLFASGDSSTTAHLVSSYPEAPMDRMGSSIPEVLHSLTSYDSLREIEVDIVHDHSLYGPVIGTSRGLPVIHTLHGPFTDELCWLFGHLAGLMGFVSISNFQRRIYPHLAYLGTIYNAIDVQAHPFRKDKDDYLLFLGRFNPDKGPHVAIEVARRLGMRLLMAGKVNETEERRFFDQVIRPLLGPDVDYMGEVTNETKLTLVAGARAVLFPISWPEPFGLVMVEAAAAGTPVIAFRNGSSPEVVEDGRSGFVVDSLEEMMSAVERIEEIDPSECRAVAEERFDVPRMVAEYETAYIRYLEIGPQALLEAAGQPPH